MKDESTQKWIDSFTDHRIEVVYNLRLKHKSTCNVKITELIKIEIRRRKLLKLIN